MSASKFYAVLAGTGPGTGRSLAMKFAAKYPTIYLLARAGSPKKSDDLKKLVEEINSSNHDCHAVFIKTDVSKSDEVKAAFSQIKQANEDKHLAAAIFNVGGDFLKTPFMETTEEQLRTKFEANGTGLVNFAKATIPLLLETVNAKPEYPPTLLVTGASASLRGKDQFAAFAAGKTALRTLSQSLAREYWPQGIHVAHAVIDGVIRTPSYERGDYGPDFVANEGMEDGTIEPEAIADAYWFLHTQRRSGWTHELDIRPFCEKTW